MSKNFVVNNLNVTYQDLFAATIKVLPEIPYDKSWENGTGYFDDLAKTKTDKVCKSVDPYGRPIMMIPCENGTIVVFRRLTNSDRLCFHVPMKITKSGVTRITAGGETFVAELSDLTESAQERQLEARMAVLATAIQYLHHRHATSH